jgi:hypothetical protein
VSSRAEIALRTGLARSTVGQQVDELIGRGIVLETVAGQSVRGRPPRALSINPAAGRFAVANVGTEATGVAVTDLTGELIELDTLPIRVEVGPEPLLEAIVERIRSLLRDNGREPSRVRQIVVGELSTVVHQTSRKAPLGGSAYRAQGTTVCSKRLATPAVVRAVTADVVRAWPPHCPVRFALA